MRKWKITMSKYTLTLIIVNNHKITFTLEQSKSTVYKDKEQKKKINEKVRERNRGMMLI